MSQRYLVSLFIYKNKQIIYFFWKSILSLLLISLAIIFLYLNQTHSVNTIPETIFDTEDTNLYKSYFTGEENDHLLYYPADNSYINEIMEKVRQDLSIHPERLQSFHNKKDMYLTLNDKQFTRTFAISFDTDPNNIKNIGKLNYSISSTSSKLSTLQKYHNDEEIVGIKEHDDYTATGFWILQYCIDINFIKIINHNIDPNNYHIEISQFPHISIKSVENNRMFTFGIFFTMLFYIILLNTYIIPLVEENQTGIMNLLKLTTPYYYYDYTIFFILRLIIYFIFSILCIIIGYYYDAIDNCVMVTILSILFIFSSMLLGNIIAVLFTNTFSTKIGGFLLLFLSILIYFVDEYKISVWFLPGNSFLYGINILQIYTNKHRAFTFYSLFENITEKSQPLYLILLILILQSIVYGCLSIFPKKMEFMKIVNKNKSSDIPPVRTKYAINLNNISKTYKHFNNKFEAIKNLSMDIEKNCITVLLGHNGAGKTTVINMITGLIEKNSGEILIDNEPQNNYNVSKLGYCSQNNIFMQYMTCSEHLKFFAQLRGMTHVEAEENTTQLLEQLKLNDKSDVYGDQLSGGMKRRLCLGIAVAGNTKSVILDEPSSGLDPETRRDLWNILLELRKERSIIVTTHHMEEAEILGDRIIILSNGKLICSGSTLQLKRDYGSGYILKLLTNQTFNENYILNVIQKEIPNARIQAIVKPTFFIILPYAERHNYSKILRNLEQHKIYYGIEHIGISDTTLEEVYLNTEKNFNTDQIDTIAQTRITIPYQKCDNEEEMKLNENENKNINNIDRNILSLQINAIFYKKIIYMKSHWKQIIAMCLIPVLATILTTVLIKSSGIQDNGKEPLELNLNHLKENGIIYFKIHDDINGNRYTKLKSCLELELPIKYHTIPIFLNNTNNNGIEMELLDIQKYNQTNALSDFYNNVIGAIEIKANNEIIMLFSTNILHSSAIMLNFLDNLILNNFECSGGNNKRIETFNLPFNQDNQIIEINPFRLDFYTIIMPIGWFLYMMMFITLPYFEERSGFKNLQTIPGFTYWITYTITDIILHLIVCGILYFVHVIFFVSMKIYDLYELNLILGAALIYGIAYLPILYLLARIFRSMSSISSFLFFIFIISTILPTITSNSEESIKDYGILISIMCILPDFLFKHQLKLINENYFNRLRNKSSTYISINPHLIGQQYHDTKKFYVYNFFIFISAELFLILLWDNIKIRNKMKMIISKLNCFRICRKDSKEENNSNNKSVYDDDDVELEKTRVSGIIKDSDRTKDYTLIVNNLQKSYENTIKVVRNVHLIVEKGQCFGLLGLNGAGKTTMFEMLTANEDITDGNILIYGKDINNRNDNDKSIIGYCPQQDALNNFMTSYQILKYMALIRGTLYKDIDKDIQNLLSDFNMLQYKNQIIQGYSGGTKRKLNAAMAMIGNPQLIYLDEPTTGVDPLSRRFIWRKIQSLQKKEKTIILTSHSMDECENLCNRLAIMANGKFKCIGYIPKLKSKFGNGLTITYRLKKSPLIKDGNDITKILEKNMTEKFENCELSEKHGEILIFFVKTDKICWADVFEKVENIFLIHLKDILEDYSINEISLEDVFLKFDKKRFQ